MNLNLIEELKTLDPNNPGVWPIPFQLALCVVLLIVVFVAGWHFHLSNQRTDLAALVDKEDELKGTMERKQRQAANLNALKEQLQEMKQSFGDMLRQLPNRTEIAGLIVDVSQTGLAAGLEFELFQPQQEQPAEFYAQLPINIRVTGTYHQFGEFVSGIAQLPRIVTTHNITIEKNNEGKLSMSAVARTYRAIEELQ